MGDYNTVNEEIRAQREKVRKMPWYKQVGHYWHYNKWIIIGIIIAVLLVASVTRSLINHRYAYVTGVFINSEATDPEVTALEQSFSETYDVNLKKYSVSFDCSLGYSVEDPTDSLSTYTPPKVLAYSEGKVGDFFICDADTFDFFAQSGYFIDLREVLTKEQLTQYEDHFYYYDAQDGNGSVPIAIRLENTGSLGSMRGYRNKELYFSIFYNSQKPEHAMDFLSLLANS